MKKVVLFLLFSLSLFADSKITVVPYVGFGSYSSNISEDDVLIGLYTFIKEKDYSVEFSVESKNQNYTDGTKLNQVNLVGAYKTYLSSTVKINGLFHYISNNAASNGTAIALIDVDKTFKKKFTLGIQVIYSIYNADTLAKNMLQIKPTLKFKYGHNRSKWGSIVPRISFYYLNPGSKNVSLENNYFSSEFALTHTKGAFISTASVWFGEQLYAVRDNGFTVYNLNELHTSGFLLSSRYKASKDIGVKISYSSEDYKTYSSAGALGAASESIERILLIADFSF